MTISATATLMAHDNVMSRSRVHPPDSPVISIHGPRTSACEALEALSAQTPLLLVLEDLQWSDVATIDLLSLLGQRQEHAKLLVLGTCRHAEIQSADHPLNRVLRSLVTRSGALLLQVPKFSEDAVQHFIDRRFAGHAFPEELTHLVAKITGGTPLFMVSLLEDLASRGLLAERDGRWALTVALEEVRAHRPASVKQLIDIQLDRMTAGEQRVLEAASIVGTDFSTHLVAAALDLPVEQFAQAHNESVYLPELLRVRGEQLEATDPAAAARDYRQAIALAHSTGARSLERRAIESLGALEARAQD